MAASNPQEPIFVDLHDNSKPTEIESLCMKCEQMGTTRFLFTKIPHFKEVIVMAFECPHCGLRNNELQSAGAFNEKGQTVSCKVNGKEDLDRQLVKSDFASVKFEEIDVEIPANNRRGLLTTVEGLVGNAIDDLSQGQAVRKHVDEDVYNKIQAIIETLESYQGGKQAFTMTIDDPSGNSYIENRCLPAQDPQLTLRWYTRTAEQNGILGLSNDQSAADQALAAHGDDDEPSEVLTFPANCSNCNSPSETNMHVLDIPHFKEVVIMATNCEHCGYKSNEVKAGGAISPKGKRITLKITDQEDLSRDILKSETCGLSIPEINLELTPGTLGGRFTTVEGLLRQVHTELEERAFSHGDSTSEDAKAKWTAFLNNLDEVADGKRIPVTLVVDDPLANSYLQNLYAPDDDPEMTIEDYERSFETNEDLGLNDMKTEDY
ncbi:ZPR1 zinc-finger domain-domain-containing protein [Absidia repens]|uniref:Zinc finger protein ZPR1 n=1 Tax=Absidia repens TaxID=90262 RepID=A0A1X2IHM1_9FUNG|nr:ZPR1 zinc-finger domain-domain-containing protein [Absidia repens]